MSHDAPFSLCQVVLTPEDLASLGVPAAECCFVTFTARLQNRGTPSFQPISEIRRFDSMADIVAAGVLPCDHMLIGYDKTLIDMVADGIDEKDWPAFSYSLLADRAREIGEDLRICKSLGDLGRKGNAGLQWSVDDQSQPAHAFAAHWFSQVFTTILGIEYREWLIDQSFVPPPSKQGGDEISITSEDMDAMCAEITAPSSIQARFSDWYTLSDRGLAVEQETPRTKDPVVTKVRRTRTWHDPVFIQVCDIEVEKDEWQAIAEPLPLQNSTLSHDHIELILTQEFPWMTNVIDKVMLDLRVGATLGCPWVHLRPFVITGAPGVGKSKFLMRLSELLGIGHASMSAAGASDDGFLRGTSYRFESRIPSLPVMTMIRQRTANPLILVDEIDKVSENTRNGNIMQTLLSMLEPVTARAWTDECLMASCDISHVNWVFTANSIEPLRGPLLSRLEVITANHPEPEHLPIIVDGIRREIAIDFGITADEVPLLAAEAYVLLAEHVKMRSSLRLIRRLVERYIDAGLTEAPVRLLS